MSSSNAPPGKTPQIGPPDAPMTLLDKLGVIAIFFGGGLALATIPIGIVEFNQGHEIAHLKDVAKRDHVTIGVLQKKVEILSSRVVGIRGVVVKIKEGPDANRSFVLVAPGHGQAAVMTSCDRRKFHARKGDWVVAHYDSNMREFVITKRIPMRSHKIVKRSR